MNEKITIGFIGQGFIGKNMADDFEKRGYKTVRYSKEEEHEKNHKHIADCDIVFIAVPTPTAPDGFNFDILKDVINLVGVGKVAVIKSTILPGTCEFLQKLYSDRFIFHSPEFLTEAKAAYDTANPTRNIVGCPINNEEYKKLAQKIIDILPKSPVNIICQAREAEMIKYASNCYLAMKVVYANTLYDLAVGEGCDWSVIRDGMIADPRIGKSHLQPVHASGITQNHGRGAGGHCFIKDLAALTNFIESKGDDSLGLAFFRSIEKKNIELLKNSHKDLDLLEGVYGEEKI
jgi:UDPglucose 6-dehydrogenase